MPEIEIPESFWEQCDQLKVRKDVRKKLAKAIRLLAENPRHPSLQSKPMEGAPGIYETRAGLNYRLTYEGLPGDVPRLRVFGTTDDKLKNP